MYLKSCCALFLLAIVACQAAPSAKIEKSISETDKFTKNEINLEETGAEKDRAKKSTTFCVEVRANGKQEQVPCRQEVRPQIPQIHQQESKPVVILQPVAVPTPVAPVEYPKPQNIVIQPQPQLQPQLQPQPQPQPQPSQNFNVIQQQQSSSVTYPQPQAQPQIVQPSPQQPNVVYTHPQQTHIHHVYPSAPSSVAPAPAPAPAPTPIINIVPAPAPAPCDKPTVMQPQQPQQIHTVHVLHPQPTPQTPSVTLVQELKSNKKEEKPVIRPKPESLPITQEQISVMPVAPAPCKTDVLVAPSRPVIVPQPTFIQVPSVQYPSIKTQEEAYECSCRPDNRLAKTITLDPRLLHLYKSVPRSSMITAEYNSNISPIVFASERASEMEGRFHHHEKTPLHLSVQFPLIQAANTYPQHYTPNYYNYGSYSTSSYPYDTSYYDSYPKGNYGYQTSNVPSVVVNAGGLYYRESQHKDLETEQNEAKEMFSNEIIENSINQKRETEPIQLQYEQQETIQNGQENTIKE